MRTQPINETNKISKLYRSIHELPLRIFIACLVANDYKKLIIEGDVSEDELYEAFEVLYLQYVESAGGKDALKKVASTSKLALMKFRVDTFQMLVDTIKIEPSEELYKLFSFYPQYNPIIKDYSLENIEYTIGQMLPHWKSERIDLMNELDHIKLQDKDQAVTHYSYEYFNSILAELESVFKTPTINEEMNVGKFCTWLNKYKEHVKIINKQNEQ